MEKKTSLLAKCYQNEDAAREYIETLIWPEGPVCPHCECIEGTDEKGRERLHYALECGKDIDCKDEKRGVRKGVYKCYSCRKQFTVTVGTIFEDSKVPLHKWLLAIKLMCTSKKGISAHQIMRNLGLGSYRTAWFMCHRIRWAMTQEPMAGMLKGIFEIDETWIGGKLRTGHGMARAGKDPNKNKTAMTSMLHREGDVRSVTGRISGETIRPIMSGLADKANAHIMTDTANKLKFGKYGWKHSAVNHSKKEYGRYVDGEFISTNQVESYFSLVKRSVHGIFHHVSRKYLDQYANEWDYRFNVRKLDDHDRTVKAIRAIRGKRLMLKALTGRPSA